MSKSRVKRLLKGLRYIIRIFEKEKEVEMQIGNPRDVKHVAHIGWDGPSINSPSWMNEFKRPPSISSAPFCLPVLGDIKENVSVKCVSQDCSGRGEKGSRSATRSLPNVPKSSRRRSSIESPSTRERPERHKARRSSKSKESTDQKQTIGLSEDSNNSPTLSLPVVHRNGRRKKPNRPKAQAAETYKAPFSDPGSGSISIISKDIGSCQTP